MNSLVTERTCDPVLPTNLLDGHFLSQRVNCDVSLISELCQITGSFKFRAAWNLVNQIDAPGFLAASSGNFGQALACAASMKNRRCTIVMPETSSRVKIAAIKSYGAQVEIVDVRRISRAQRVRDISVRLPDYYVASAYDCDHVIAGNASLGRELAEITPPFDIIITPVGGGGLSAGIITGLRSKGIHTSVWGAEPSIANDASRSLRSGALIANDEEPNTLADGARTMSLGTRNFDILVREMKGIVEIPEHLIPVAMKYLHQGGLRVEPTGALSLAAILSDNAVFAGMRVGCVLSGGNVDQELYQELVV